MKQLKIGDMDKLINTFHTLKEEQKLVIICVVAWENTMAGMLIPLFEEMAFQFVNILKAKMLTDFQLANLLHDVKTNGSSAEAFIKELIEGTSKELGL